MILIAGPCVIESRDFVLKMAQKLEKFARLEGVEFYFKSSFDKANRTSLSSFRGPGLQKGCEILAEVKREFGFKILTDIHEPYQAAEAARVADMLQIPAFLCRQTDLLVAAAQTNAQINIKKGQFLTAAAMRYSVEKILHIRQNPNSNLTQNEQASGLHAAPSLRQKAESHGICVCERGNSFGYGNLVVDMRNLQILKEIAPVIFDVTHSVQMPASSGCTGGDSAFAPLLARAAAAAGVDGFFYETHIKPSEALSDGANMLSVEDFEKSVNEILKIRNALKN